MIRPVPIPKTPGYFLLVLAEDITLLFLFIYNGFIYCGFIYYGSIYYGFITGFIIPTFQHGRDTEMGEGEAGKSMLQPNPDRPKRLTANRHYYFKRAVRLPGFGTTLPGISAIRGNRIRFIGARVIRGSDAWKIRVSTQGIHLESTRAQKHEIRPIS